MREAFRVFVGTSIRASQKVQVRRQIDIDRGVEQASELEDAPREAGMKAGNSQYSNV